MAKIPLFVYFQTLRVVVDNFCTISMYILPRNENITFLEVCYIQIFQTE